MGFDNSTDPLTTSCLDTHDADNLMFTDTSVDNAANRQWWWILCNEPFASWQEYVIHSLIPLNNVGFSCWLGLSDCAI